MRNDRSTLPRTRCCRARLTLAVDYIALNKALGGGWLGRLDVTRKEVEDGYTGPHIPSPWSPAIVHP